MSAFLSRLAAKAVGQAAAAQPRLPGLFEASSDPFDTLEVVDEVVAVDADPVATPASADRPAGDATSRPVSPPARSPTAGNVTIDSATQRPEPAWPIERRDESGRSDRQRTRTVVSDQPAIVDVADASGPDPVPVPMTSLTVPAVPLSAATPVASSSASEPMRRAPPSAAEPPPVRVHIGRLEVRASLPEGPPVRPPAPKGREEGTEGVSLADYLRGVR